MEEIEKIHNLRIEYLQVLSRFSSHDDRRQAVELANTLISNLPVGTLKNPNLDSVLKPIRDALAKLPDVSAEERDKLQMKAGIKKLDINVPPYNPHIVAEFNKLENAEIVLPQVGEVVKISRPNEDSFQTPPAGLDMVDPTIVSNKERPEFPAGELISESAEAEVFSRRYEDRLKLSERRSRSELAKSDLKEVDRSNTDQRGMSEHQL